MSRPPVLAFLKMERLFLVIVDTSGIVIGAGLVQKPSCGKYHLVQVACRTVASKERLSSTFEQEALSIVFELYKHRHFLHRKSFLVFSDHQLLRMTFDKINIHSRLARWLNLVVEYEFQIRRRPSEKKVVAHYLSRSVRSHQSLSDSVDGKLETLLERSEETSGD